MGIRSIGARPQCRNLLAFGSDTVCLRRNDTGDRGSRGWTEERDPVFISAEVDWRAAWNRRGMCLKSLGYERRHDRGHLNEH